jgi:homocitrate synthase NifV
LNLPGMLTCWCRAVKKDIELVVSCNTPIEETAIALFGIGAQKSNMRLSELARLCNTVARFSGQPIHAAKPIVGSRIFFHEFSIHCAGLLKDTNFYELYDPEQVGRRNSRQMVLGVHSGSAAIKHALAHWNSNIDADAAQRLLPRGRAVKKDVELAVGGWDIIWVDKKQVLILYPKEYLNPNQFFSEIIPEIAGHPP